MVPTRPTVREALREATALLAGRSSPVREDTPRLDALLLLVHALDVSRSWLLARPERPLLPAEAAAFAALEARRMSGEPVAYITGRKAFMGHTFAVDRRVLIPRPETELLVEIAHARLAAGGQDQVAADIGTGSGAIAVSLAALLPRLRVWAVDASASALAVARHNAWRILDRDASRVRFAHGSLLEALPEPVRLIAANLPYIQAGRLQALPVPVRAFEPAAALDGGGDGLDLYRRLLAQLPGRLLPGGVVLMECDPAQASVLACLASASMPGAQATVHQDLAGQDRIVELSA